MKAINESYLGDSSPVVSDVKDTDAGDTDDARGRSRARRRTAREIAVMFDQLKQRHITRKKEWIEEKEELLAKLKTAEESKRVLDGLRVVLLNLRTELRDEEDRRIALEESYAEESELWMQEKQDLLNQLNEAKMSHHRSLSKDSDMVNLRKKIKEQDDQISQWKRKTVEMQKDIIEQGKIYEEQCKSKEDVLRQERVKWEEAKIQMENEIKTLREHSELSELMSSVKTETNQSTDQEDRDQVSDTKTKYNEFHKTVNDALREIEKVSDDLRNIDNTKENQRSHHPKLSDRGDSISSLSFSDMVRSDTNDTGNTLINIESTNDSSRSNSSSNTVKSHLRITKPVSPTADNYQKIVRRISQVDIAISSPEIKELTSTTPVKLNSTTTPSPFVPITESDTLVTSPESTGKPIMTLYDPYHMDTQNKRASLRSLSHTSSDSAAASYERGRSTSSEMIKNKIKTLYKNDSLNESMGSLHSQSYRSVSPKLPKLHQQLLFKGKELPKEKISMKRFTPSLVHTKQNSFSESLSSPPADTKLGRQKSFESNRVEATKSNEKEDFKSYTPYFDSKMGYVPRTKPVTVRQTAHRLSVNTPESFSSFASNKSGEDERRFSANFISDSNSNALSDNNSYPRIIAPPMTRPKPNITLEKDHRGNVLGVKMGSESLVSVHRNNHNNQNLAQDFIEAPEVDLPELHKTKELNHTGSMSRGRNWIRKRLNIKDNKKIQPETVDKIVDPVRPMDQLNHKETIDKLNRSSSFLKPEGKNSKKLIKKRSKSAHGQSSSDESDENSHKRESFLSWKNRKRNKNKQEGGDKRKNKAYNRSNTEGTGFEMKNFLSRFKVSQSNPRKPSIVKQFELKLLENEVKQMNDEETRGKVVHKREKMLEPAANVNTRMQMRPDAGYTGEDEWERNPDGTIRRRKKTSSSSSAMSPPLRKQENIPPKTDVKIRPRGGYTKSGKPSYRRSMSDMNSLQIPLKNMFSSNLSNENVINENANRKRHTAGLPKNGETTQKSVVSDLIMRFAGPPKSTNNSLQPQTERLTLAKSPSPFKPASPRERTVSAISPSRFEPKLLRYNSHIGLNIERGISPPTTSIETPVTNVVPQSNDTPNENKLQFNEKVNILQKALSKKPARRYKRADTQPIRSPGFDSTETSSDELDKAEILKRNTAMNENIGSVSTALSSDLKFNKPLAPRSRRRPTRWAR